jgi:hypothetical protein
MDERAGFTSVGVPTDTLPDVAIRVSGFYSGPPGSVNGGWAAGLAAGLLTDPDTAPGTPVEVTLRAPVPIDAPITGMRDGERAFLIDAAGATLAETTLAPAIAPAPAFVPVDVAARAGAPDNRVATPFPDYFGCGPDRRGGLRVTVGATGAKSGDTFAGIWTPPAAAGELPARYIWAALDCPTGLVHPAAGGTTLLGRITLAQHRATEAGEPHVIVARATGGERRKRFSVAALYTAGGDLVANAAAVWITLREAEPQHRP